MEWDSVIGRDATPKEQAAALLPIIDQNWIEDGVLPKPPYSNPVKELTAYLSALFTTEDKVGIVVDSWKTPPDGDGKSGFAPCKGEWSRTAGEIIEKLAKAKDLGAVIGDWVPEAGAWCRFNPLDGKGVADLNVVAYRYALVESDDIGVERQFAILKELQLPIATLVHSAGKSLHALVRVDANDYKEYQSRVDFLYEVCKKNGLPIDRKNRNPSRLSRLPGATRNGKRQALLALNMGLPSWAEWTDWIAAQNDDLPEVECLADFIDNPPPLKDSLIDGILRQGHKMRLAGPSKAGKSFALLHLAIAIAEGEDWLGWRCQSGRVLYVNLELDPASVYHRLKDVYEATGIEPKNAASVDVWNLRGKATPMFDLAPRLIRRALKKRAAGKPYAAVIIDPIYKVLTGDENAADQMSKFCNQFDKICNELGTAVIDCHHHSKGDQGQKRAGDRASGSGVFHRDPDALLDLIELDIDQQRRDRILAQWRVEYLIELLDAKCKHDWRDDTDLKDMGSPDKLLELCVKAKLRDEAARLWEKAEEQAAICTAWRLEGSLREFPAFPPKRFFFRYPIHPGDPTNLLAGARAAGELPTALEKAQAIARKQDQIDKEMETAFEALDTGEPVTIAGLAEYLQVSKDAVRKRIQKGEERGSTVRYKGQIAFRKEGE